MKIIIFMLAMMATLPSFGQAKGEMPFTTTSPDAYKLLRQALVAYGDANLDEGARLSKECLAKDPDFAMAYGMMYTPDPEQRKVNIAKAESLKSSADEKLYLAGLRARIDNKPTAEFFTPVLAKYPKDEYLHIIAILNSDTKARIEIGEGVVKRNPKFAPAYNLLGYAYMDQSEMGKAETAFNKYISLRPDLSNAFDSKGDYMMRTGNYKEAVTLFEKAYAMGMTVSGVKAQRANARLRNPKLSDKDVEEIRKVVGTSMEEYKNGNVDGYLGYQSDKAIEVFASQMSNIGGANIRQRLTDLFKNGSFTKIQTTIKSVQGLGPLALALGRIEWTFKSNSTNEATDFNRSVVFMLDRQGDGSWKTIGFVNDMANQTENSDDVAGARKVLSNWNGVIKPGETIEDKNVDALAALYSSQAIEIFSNGRSNVGLGNLRARWSGFAGTKWEHSTLGTIGVEVSGRKAIAWGTAVQNFYPKGEEKLFKEAFPWICVLTKEKDDQWRILAFHWLEE